MKSYKTASCEEFERLANAFDEEKLIIHVAAESCVWTGLPRTLNRAECERRGLRIGRGRYLGGSIVCMPGDLSLCRVTRGRSEWAAMLTGLLAAWLKTKQIPAAVEENDVLADGKKVASWASFLTKDGWCQSVVHFSIGPMDVEAVEAICTKPMKKVPGSLGEYGITAQEIMREFHIEGVSDDEQ